MKYAIPLSGILLIPEIEPFIQEWGEVVIVVVVEGCCSLLHRNIVMQQVNGSKLSPGVNTVKISSVDQHMGWKGCLVLKRNFCSASALKVAPSNPSIWGSENAARITSIVVSEAKTYGFSIALHHVNRTLATLPIGKWHITNLHYARWLVILCSRT